MLMILAVFSIFFGFITKDMFIGLGSGFFSDNALFIHPSHEIMLDTEFAVPTLFKLLPLVFTISLSVISIVLSEYLSTILIYFKLSRVGYNIFSFFNQRFLIELFYNRYITGIVLKLGGQTTKVLDKGSVEYIGPYGLEKGLLNISNNIAKLSTGVITSYALYILIGLILYLLFYSFIDNSIIILVLVISLSLISFKSSAYSNTAYESAFHATLLRSSTLYALVDVLNTVVDSIPSGQVLLDAAQAASNTPQEVSANIAAEAASKQNELTAAYESARDYATSQSIGADAQTSSDIQAATNSANQLYHDGTRDLGQSVQLAKELMEDQSS